MITLIPADFKSLVVTKSDLAVASIAWGFTLGFGFLTAWTAITQTSEIRGRYGISKLNSPYVWMLWLEILVCASFSIISWLHLWGFIPPSFGFFFVILTLWALQVQFLLQIIINRVAIISTNRRRVLVLKVGVAILITAINISVYNIWIPARLQISEKYIRINDIWDRCEKCIYLVVDGCLNWYFIRIVKQKLVRQGLTKYDQLVRFNMWIIGFSLSIDCLIIGMMSLKNSFVYMQFHPLAYIVKLNIEMSMANLIAKVSSSSNNIIDGTHRIVLQEPQSPLRKDHTNIRRLTASSDASRTFTPKESKWDSVEMYSPSSEIVMNEIFDRRNTHGQGEISVSMKREVHVQVERRNSAGVSSKEGSSDCGSGTPRGLDTDEDMTPLKEEHREREDAKRTGVDMGMGTFTKVWGPQ